jgi:hypothetical protein
MIELFSDEIIDDADFWQEAGQLFVQSISRADCGTGAGGFKPGNTCATGGKGQASLTAERRLKSADPQSYFKAKGDELVDPQKLITDPSKDSSLDNAAKFMNKAADGEMEKRKPIDVYKSPDGDLYVLDGQSTTNIAKLNGLEAVAVNYVDANKYAEQLVTVKSSDIPIKSAQVSYAEHASAAKENMDSSPDSFQAVLDMGQGLVQDLGGTVGDYKALLQADDIDGATLVMGPIKTSESAARKVRDKYNGDYQKLTDVVRATVLLDLDQMDAAVDMLESEANQRGWKMRREDITNRMGASKTGYRDLALKLEAPNGQIAEIQLNTFDMWKAKSTEGHKMYEEWRLLDKKPERTEQDESRMAELELSQRKLYEKAWATAVRKQMAKK